MENVAKVWEEAFLEYRYRKVNLNNVKKRFSQIPPDCLNREVGAEIEEVIDFLDYFKQKSFFSYCPYLEVLAWYYYFQIVKNWKGSVSLFGRILESFNDEVIKPDSLFILLKDFSRKPSFGKMEHMAKLLNVYPNWRPLAVLLSFFSPEKFVLFNNDILNLLRNNRSELRVDFEVKNTNISKLIPDSYNLFINISNWCSRVAQALTEAAKLSDTVHKKNWTAFDVEKALHTFAKKYKKTKEVPPIPKIH